MSNIAHVELTCYRDDCHAVITLHRQDYQRLQESHGTFYCPAGHGQCFSGKSANEKRIEQLEAEIRSWRDDSSYWGEHRARLIEVVGQVRAGAIVCPFGCGWSTPRRLSPWQASAEDDEGTTVARFFDRVWGDLREHLEHEHHATPKIAQAADRGEAHA